MVAVQLADPMLDHEQTRRCRRPLARTTARVPFGQRRIVRSLLRHMLGNRFLEQPRRLSSRSYTSNAPASSACANANSSIARANSRRASPRVPVPPTSRIPFHEHVSNIRQTPNFYNEM
jgi:hypothetical protein